MKKIEEELIIDFIPWQYPNQDDDKRMKIQKAIHNQMMLKIHYSNMKNEKSQRTIEPMTLIFRGYHWYLFAFCLEKDDYRLFKLTRIKNIEQVFHVFKRREKKFSDVFDQKEDKREKIKLKLKFKTSVRYRIEEWVSEEDLVLDENGNIIVEWKFPHDEWIYSYILGFSDQVEVLEPKEVRLEIAKRIKKMQKVY